MASASLSRAGSDPTSSNTTATYSVWLKRSSLGATQTFWSGGYYSSDNVFFIRFNSSDQLQVFSRRGASTKADIRPNRVFRDVSAWYHIVVAVDSTQGTASDRIKIYVNGEQETSFSTNTTPSQNENLYLDAGAGTNYYIGQKGGSAEYFNGSMAHFHYADGTAYTPTTFGETDSTTGIWKAKVSPTVNYGNKGVFLKFDNSANMGLDSSGGSRNFTTSGTIIQNKDTPSNVFATFNPLDNYYPAMTLSNGNTRALTIGGKYTYIPSTLGMTSGKYYAEIKCTAQSGSQEEFLVGITSTQTTATTHEVGHYGNDYGYNGVAGQYRTSNANTSYGAAYTTGDIIGIAVDLDNNKLYFSKNGVFQNSGVPTSGSTGTGAINITDSSSTVLGAYFFAVCYFSSTNTGTYDANFGNGYFGTTAVSSAQNPDDGNGIFEYDVPAGYRALCTKSLNAEEYS